MIETKLEWYEVQRAAYVGVERHIRAVQRGARNAHGMQATEVEGLVCHIDGACGECAYCKATQRYWPASVDTFKLPDVGRNIQVRTRSRPDYELIVRPDDPPNDAFVLVTGTIPLYHVVGWIKAADAHRPEWWQTHGNRPGAWFVPHHALKSFRVETQ